MPARHQQRVASRIKFLVSHVLQHEIMDPRLGFVTVLRVEPTVDLKEAKVYLSILGTEADRTKCVRLLEDANGFIRRQVGKGLKLRHTPLLRFVIDDRQDSVTRIENILKQVKTEKDEET